MNVLFISIDSLRRDFLGTYRDHPICVDYEVDTPNFDRFAARSVVFDTHFAGSLPCMPARREWLTGTKEFIWRPWGPVEPFDLTLPQAARSADVLSQLITDHFHYFQHGSDGYYKDFNGFEFVRGHENDRWRTSPRHPKSRLLDQTLDREIDPPGALQFLNRAQYARNVDSIEEETEEGFFAPRVFAETARWLRDNRDWSEWFCYVDSFDVHEPFHCPDPYASMYTSEDPRDPELPVWPYYGPTDRGQSRLNDRQMEFIRSQFAGKVTMTDRWFGEVLKTLDEEALWDETVVIVTSDHGFFLGEHGWMGKNKFPIFNILAHTPLMIWHPDSQRTGERVSALTTAVDLYATILDAIEADVESLRHSESLYPLLLGDADAHRDQVLYGYWGTSMNVTDGRYTYHHPTRLSEPADCYSTTMMNPHSWFTPPTPKPEAETASLPYTDAPVWRYSAESYQQLEQPMLFDLNEGFANEENVFGDSPARDEQMQEVLIDGLQAIESPPSTYRRLGLD